MGTIVAAAGMSMVMMMAHGVVVRAIRGHVDDGRGGKRAAGDPV
jgi:hypothetical protein